MAASRSVQAEVDAEMAAVFAQLLPPAAAAELALPRDALAPADLRRVHAWLEAEHARGAARVRAPEIYTPTIDDCAPIRPAEGSVLLDFEAEAVGEL